MVSRSLAVLAAASFASALTPAGFQPGSQTPLIVSYGNIAGLDGAVLPRDSTQTQPTIATERKLTGQYAVVMIDLDIPTNTPPQTGTLLHWMQTGLSSADTTTSLNTTAGTRNVFLLQNRQQTAPLAPYIGPNPPARTPLSHRYTFIVVDHTQITQQGLSALSTAAQTRRDFNALTVLTAANLQNNVVAGNFFNVTNSGRAEGGGTFGNNTGGASPTGGSPNSPSPSVPIAAGISLSPAAGVMSLCLVAVGVVFLGL